jgi:hypothetical protein
VSFHVEKCVLSLHRKQQQATDYGTQIRADEFANAETGQGKGIIRKVSEVFSRNRCPKNVAVKMRTVQNANNYDDPERDDNKTRTTTVAENRFVNCCDVL